MKFMKSRLVLGSAAMAMVGGATFVHTYSSLRDSPDSATLASSSSSVSVFSSFHDLFASQSAEDWVSNSDYVLNVTMISEQAGEGDRFFTARLGEFETHEVLYKRRGAPDLDPTFSMRVLGWAHPGGGSSSEHARVATLGSPRLEVGHRYIVGVVNYEPRCSPEDGLDPGGWALVGSNGAIPFDDGRLGWGEVEGRSDAHIDPDLGTLQAAVVRDAMSLEDLRDVLANATIQQRPKQPGVRIGC
jgi:hypothetical protein